MVREYAAPLVAADVDTVILGCTHYPMVERLIRRSLPGVTLIKSGEEIAREVRETLARKELARPPGAEGGYRFACSGDAGAFRELGSRFLQMPLGPVASVDPEAVPVADAPASAGQPPARHPDRGGRRGARRPAGDRCPRRARPEPGDRPPHRRWSTCTGSWATSCVGTLRFYPAPLARAGFPVLVLETRMADVGQLFGQAIFEDAIQDVDAAVAWLREQGFDTIVLSGYSSGATLATRYAATHHVPDLRGLVCLGNPWGLPQSMQRARRRASAPAALRGAARTVEDGPRRRSRRPRARPPVPGGAQPGPVARRRPTARSTPTAPGGTRAAPPPCRPWPTARSGRCGRRSCWCRAPTTRWCAYEEAERLAEVARAAGNLRRHRRARSRAGHTFKGGEIATRDAVVSWLRRRA